MLFSSGTFLFGFLPVVTILYYVFSKHRRLQNFLLTLSSLFFYAWGEPVFVLIMLFSITANFFFGLAVNRSIVNGKRGKAAVVISVIFNLTILFIFKYLTFTLSNINALVGRNVFVLNIALPIGISFFSFQAMSYVIDVYRSKAKVQHNIINLALYISFFPQLIAGPIVRYETVAEQISNRKETVDDFCNGILRFVIGLSKKMLIANNMSLIADKVFGASELSVVSAWIGALAYTLQIYYDFSGYSDMAIGIGRMFGFKFLENFNHPYASKSISEFWRRWHISLGTWFRDYVYIPLGGSRVNSKFKLLRNLFIVWFLTGLWHGANWTFVVWGLMYFLLLALEKLTPFGLKISKLPVIRYIYTLFFVVIGWVIFRSESLPMAASYISAMFGSTGIINDSTTAALLMPNLVFFVAGIILSFPIAEAVKKKLNLNQKLCSAIRCSILIVFLIMDLSYIVIGSNNPFIYFNF